MRFSTPLSRPTISIDNRNISTILSVGKIKKKRGVAQVGSALGSGLRSRWFKSSRPDFSSLSTQIQFNNSNFVGGRRPRLPLDCQDI